MNENCEYLVVTWNSRFQLKKRVFPGVSFIRTVVFGLPPFGFITICFGGRFREIPMEPLEAKANGACRDRTPSGVRRAGVRRQNLR